MCVSISWTIILPFRKKIGGHRTNYLPGGPKLTPPHRLLGYVNIKREGVVFCHLYITYYLYKVTQHCNANKK